MTNYIKVSTRPEDSRSWSHQMGWPESDFTEFNHVKDLLKSKKAVGLLSASLIPVRTNNLKNFAKDFFLPTTVNRAIKVQNLVGKIFAILGALLLDVMTFPARLLTCIPRIISNARQEEHPLLKYLVDKGSMIKYLELDSVKVTIGWVEQESNETTLENGVVQKEIIKFQNKERFYLNFIEVPTYNRHSEVQKSRNPI